MQDIRTQTLEHALAPPSLDTRRHALFLDLDGTLVDFALKPEDVVVGDALRAMLQTLATTFDGAIALLTGRTIESAEIVLSGAIHNIGGLHGFERRYAGATTRPDDDLAPIQAALADAKAMVASGALQARIEDKSAGLALHYRDTPHAGRAVRRTAEQLAETHGLTLLEGKMVAELTLGVRTKGDALRAFMQEAPFHGRIPVAVGDDVTDEDAFVAAHEAGGFGVLVGAKDNSAATHALPNIAAVIRWLEAAAAR